MKWDGYRALSVKDHQTVRLISCHKKDLTSSSRSVVSAVAALPAKRLMLDGEIVSFDAAAARDRR